MADDKYMDPDHIRDLFSRGMSSMYQAEVPLYGDLLTLVASINEQKAKEQLTDISEQARLSVERHGAIRVGTPEELALFTRLFVIMGMQAVGYYDLTTAGVPVHSTAFRPISEAALASNPFRIFTSLLRLELISDVALREQAKQILAKRDIFTERLRELITLCEQQSGLTHAQAHDFVGEALHTFRWHALANVDLATYQALHQAHPLIADVVCFQGPHINHLTPRTLDIDAAQQQMIKSGMDTKAHIEGPPTRHCPILLRQTSFKAQAETIRFADGHEGVHSARFGEIEQRGAALTTKGRALYDALLVKAGEDIQERSTDAYQDHLRAVFSAFPDTWQQLHAQQLAFFYYHLTSTGQAAQGRYTPDTLPDAQTLVNEGLLSITPIIYEDFLPVSAAGIFQSNLASHTFIPPSDRANSLVLDTETAMRCISQSQLEFERALGQKIIEPNYLYAQQMHQSFQAATAYLMGIKH
ncbi:2-oxoadipate dioxygenase/decarboxylase HglS [Oceanisphaera avium]|uniref:2-oxoadipate dioxygenase/decarboxylase HglS n=1 Tax=Oceanisphaera avium TaxID=1903694 RepID=UPI0018DF77CB|nr:DUF1338 family protein [Oceanisphaera avium]